MALAGLPADGTIAAEVAFMFNEWYRPDCCLEFPRGGSQAIVQALVRCAFIWEDREGSRACAVPCAVRLAAHLGRGACMHTGLTFLMSPLQKGGYQAGSSSRESHLQT